MKYSLRQILVFSFIFIGLAGVILVMSISWFFYRYNLNQTVEHQTEVLEVVSNAIAGPYLTFREPMAPMSIENLFRTTLGVQGAVFIRRVDNQNIVEISGNREETGMKVDNPPLFETRVASRNGVFQGESIKEFSVKARDGSKLWLGVSLKAVKRNILLAAVLLGFIVAALVAVLAGMIFFVFRKLIINPLVLLMRAFERLKEKDYKARVGNTVVIEVQKVFKSFNAMAEELDVSQTKLKAAYETEKKARLEMENLDKVKSQFLLTTQHHLRSPLTVIKGHLELLLKNRAGPLAAPVQNSLQKIDDAINRLTKLVNDFLDISQLRVGKGIFNPQLMGLKPLLDSILDDLKDGIAKKQLTVSYESDPQLWSPVLVDPVRFREALYIFIDNAVKYNKENGRIIFSSEIKKHPSDAAKKLFQLRIQDTGIGINKDDLDKLFIQSFARGKEAEKVHPLGKGIGLVLAKNIVEAHHGRVLVESEGADKGSKFIIELEISSQ